MNNSSSNQGPVTSEEVIAALELASKSHGNIGGKAVLEILGRIFNRGLDFSNGNPFPPIFEAAQRIAEETKAQKRARWKAWKKEHRNHSWKSGGCGSYEYTYSYGCGKKSHGRAPSGETRTIPVE